MVAHSALTIAQGPMNVLWVVCSFIYLCININNYVVLTPEIGLQIWVGQFFKNKIWWANEPFFSSSLQFFYCMHEFPALIREKCAFSKLYRNSALFNFLLFINFISFIVFFFLIVKFIIFWFLFGRFFFFKIN